jgi:hypothetical protein
MIALPDAGREAEQLIFLDTHTLSAISLNKRSSMGCSREGAEIAIGHMIPKKINGGEDRGRRRKDRFFRTAAA